MSILSVPLTIRSTQRLGQIAIVFTRHGFGHFIARIRLKRYIPLFDRIMSRKQKIPAEHPKQMRIGQRLVAICEELGPTFVKLGQLLSSRPDLLPPDIIEDLQQLQDKVAPFPTHQAHKIIEEEFGKPVTKLFSEFGPEPLASGSIAQTYRAKTKDGRDVVVKIRRPFIEHIIKLDMHLLEKLAESIEHHVPELRIYKPVMIIEEFNQSITRELDLLNEATVTDRICTFFADNPNVTIPSVIWPLTTNRVLTMTYVKGLEFNYAMNNPEIHINKPVIAKELIRCFMKQFLELGLFHADPHPGNILIIPPDRFALIDFGMAGQFDVNRCTSLIMMLLAGNYRQMDLVMDILYDMNAIGLDTDVELLKRDIITMIDKYQALPLKFMDFRTIFFEVLSLTRKHHIVLPRDFVLVGKSLVAIGGAALMLDPNMNPVEIIRPEVRRAVARLFSRENVSREMILSVWHSSLLIKDMPKQIREFTRKTLRGQMRFQFDTPQVDQLTRELDRSSNRMSFAIIIASIIIGSSLIFHAKVGPFWAGMPVLGLTGFLVAGIMGLSLVIAILKSGKMS